MGGLGQRAAGGRLVQDPTPPSSYPTGSWTNSEILLTLAHPRPVESGAVGVDPGISILYASQVSLSCSR